ncbi:hypothetical protein [Desulfosporosinus acidiphilus]|nr:hypothetical protein [Desulfosporosinus acidiphilus]
MEIFGIKSKAGAMFSAYVYGNISMYFRGCIQGFSTLEMKVQ